MAALSASGYSILSGLASTLGLKPIWSQLSGDAASDVNDWLAYALADSTQSPQLIALRQQVKLILGSSVTPDAKKLFEYYRGLLDGIAPFPANVTPAAWFDGNQQAFSDLAGTVPVSSGLIRRLNEGAPLTGAWTSPSDPERPTRDSSSVRFDMNGTVGGSQLTRPDPGGIFRDSCTIVVAYVARDNSFAGPLMGLFEESSQQLGVRISSNTVWGMCTAGNFFTNLVVAPGKVNVIALTYTPGVNGGVEAKLDADGTISSATMSATLAHTAPSSWIVGRDGASYLYGSVPQAIVVASPLQGVYRDALMNYAKYQVVPPAYPTDRPLILGIGDSITRATGASYNLSYLMLAVENLRTLAPIEVCNVAVGGIGVTGLLQPISDAQSLVLRGDAFYSAARAKNIAVWLLGSNDAANGNSTGYILNGTGAAPGSGLYPAMAYMKSRGWRNIVLTLGPRTDALAISNNFEAKRIAVNNDIATNWRTYADAFVDTRGIANFGGATDSNNPTYYSVDMIHPNNNGHALIEPTVRAAIQSLL